jgi:hypothetical protein
MAEFKLFMLFLGCKPDGRHVEQHDVFFGIATSLIELIPDIKGFWPEAADKIHIDAWREVTNVDGYQLKIDRRTSGDTPTHQQKPGLFFINLGGYQENVFSEQHYILLVAKDDKASAFKAAKETLFFQHNHFAGANAHIDDKYGVDVDDIYQIEDILSAHHREMYRIALTPSTGLSEDPIHLGYLKLSALVGDR